MAIATSHDAEREELEALVTSPGWRRFVAFVEAQYGVGAYRQHAQRILRGVPVSRDAEAEASLTMLQLEAVTREVEKLFAWPDSRLRTLRQAEARRASAGRRRAGTTKPAPHQVPREPTLD